MADLFAIHVPVLELVLRGTLVYWLLFRIFRFVLRRDVGAVGIADILLLVIIADAAQNAMSGGYDTFTEGAILVLTIVAWNWLLDCAFISIPRGAPLRDAAHGSRWCGAACRSGATCAASSSRWRSSRRSCASRASRKWPT